MTWGVRAAPSNPPTLRGPAQPCRSATAAILFQAIRERASATCACIDLSIRTSGDGAQLQ